MDKKTTVHVAAEAAVLGALTLYLVNRVSGLEQRIATLERELLVVAKKEAKVEQAHGAALKTLLTNDANPIAPHHVHNHPHPHPQPQQHHVAPVADRAPPVQGRRVTFSDDPDGDEDDDLMDREFGGGSEEEEASESPQPVPKKKAGRGGRSKLKVASTPAKKNPKGKDMDDVRAKAEAMRRAAEADE